MKDPVSILGYWRGFSVSGSAGGGLEQGPGRFPSAPEPLIGTAIHFNLRNIRE
jgi:hypothetical protein